MKCKILADTEKKVRSLHEIFLDVESEEAVKKYKGRFSEEIYQLCGLWNFKTNKIVCNIGGIHLGLAIEKRLCKELDFKKGFERRLMDGWHGFRLSRIKTDPDLCYIKYESTYFGKIPGEDQARLKVLLTEIIENDPVEGFKLTLHELHS